MGTFTALGERDFTELAAAFGLPAITEHEAISAGTINSNFRIVAGGTPYFLRVNEGKSEDDVRYESLLVAWLSRNGVPTPAPLFSATSADAYVALGTKWVSVFPWRDGHHRLQPDPDDAWRLGAALAQLHVAGLKAPTAWRRASIYDHAHLVERFISFAQAGDPALAHAISILRDELAHAAAAAPSRRDATHGIIHGDLFRDNVLWGNEGIAAILDFEQASGGSLAYDLAVCLNDWCWGDSAGRGFLVDNAARLLAGYQHHRPLLDVDRTALLIEVRAAAARFTITRITDVYLAKVANPEKDFRAFLARVEGWRGGALGQLSSLL